MFAPWNTSSAGGLSRVIRSECRTSLSANCGCWHAPPVSTSTVLIVVPGCEFGADWNPSAPKIWSFRTHELVAQVPPIAMHIAYDSCGAARADRTGLGIARRSFVVCGTVQCAWW